MISREVVEFVYDKGGELLDEIAPDENGCGKYLARVGEGNQRRQA
jgi:hypothetical protein